MVFIVFFSTSSSYTLLYHGRRCRHFFIFYCRFTPPSKVVHLYPVCVNSTARWVTISHIIFRLLFCVLTLLALLLSLLVSFGLSFFRLVRCLVFVLYGTTQYMRFCFSECSFVYVFCVCRYFFSLLYYKREKSMNESIVVALQVDKQSREKNH